MKWFWITAVFYLAIRVKSESTRSDALTDPIKITMIDITDGNAKICIEGATLKPDKSYTLSITAQDVIVNFEASPPTEDKCIIFQYDFADLTEKEYVEIVIHIEGDFMSYVAGSISKFPTIPFPEVICSLVEDPSNNGDHLLRISAKTDIKELLVIGTNLLVTATNINYYNKIEKSLETLACYTTVPDSISVCGLKITPTVEPTTSKMVNSATLEIKDPATSAAINLQVPSELATNSIDIIITSENSEEIELRLTNPGDSLIYEFTRGEHGSDTYNIRVLANEADKITVTTFVTIHDRDLFLSQIGTDILEGIWMHDHEVGASDKVYQFYSPDGKLLADVDCSHLTMTHCYGYITDVGKNTYTMKIAPKINGDPNTKDENQNSGKVENLQELAILSRHTTRHRNQLMTDVKICFEHLTSPEGLSFSHYEMLIINEKGQWLKHRIIEEEGGEDASEGGLCFAPFTISTKDFDLTEGTKVVVSQRGVDGVTVLATGEAALF